MNPNTALQHISMGAMMSLGAGNIRYDGEDTVYFDARILPMTAKGRATAPLRMTVALTLNGRDLYDIRVTYPQRGDRLGFKPPVVHFEITDVYADDLSGTLVALDYDGPTVLNPRLVPA